MLKLALCVLAGQVASAQFGGFGDLINGLRSVMPPLPTALPTLPGPSAIVDFLGGSSLPQIPSIPMEPSAIIDSIKDIIGGSIVGTPLPVPTEFVDIVTDIADGSRLPPALPSDLNGPYLSLINGSSVPGGMVPSDLAGVLNDIKNGSPLPADITDRKQELEDLLAGSPLPTRRMPSLPVIPGMPSIDMSMYEDMLQQMFDSVRGLFDGIDLPTKDLAGALRAQGFEVPSIDPQRLMENRDEYLAKIREQFQHLADKLRSDEVRNIREELSGMMRNRENFNMSMAEGYLNKLGGLADPTGRLNSTLGGALKNISMDSVHDSLRRISSLVSQGQEKFEKITSDFQFVAQKIRERAENFLEANGSSVRLPPLPLLNQTLSITQWSGNPYAGILTSRGINSSVVSVMLADLSSGNETVVRGLEELINITLPLVRGAAGDEKPECVYWNSSVADWLGDGCRVQDILDGAVVCGCNHLTDFAVALVPAAVASPSSVAAASPNPRPSPPMILLATGTGAAPSTSKDMRPVIGGVVGGVAGSVLLSIVAANMWDRRKKARLLRKSIVSIQNKNPVATMV